MREQEENAESPIVEFLRQLAAKYGKKSLFALNEEIPGRIFNNDKELSLPRDAYGNHARGFVQDMTTLHRYLPTSIPLLTKESVNKLRELFWKLDDDLDNDTNFQQYLHEQMSRLKPDEAAKLHKDIYQAYRFATIGFLTDYNTKNAKQATAFSTQEIRQLISVANIGYAEFPEEYDEAFWRARQAAEKTLVANLKNFFGDALLAPQNMESNLKLNAEKLCQENYIRAHGKERIIKLIDEHAKLAQEDKPENAALYVQMAEYFKASLSHNAAVAETTLKKITAETLPELAPPKMATPRAEIPPPKAPGFLTRLKNALFSDNKNNKTPEPASVSAPERLQQHGDIKNELNGLASQWQELEKLPINKENLAKFHEFFAKVTELNKKAPQTDKTVIMDYICKINFKFDPRNRQNDAEAEERDAKSTAWQKKPRAEGIKNHLPVSKPEPQENSDAKQQPTVKKPAMTA